MKRKNLITIIILAIVLTISFVITFVVFRNNTENRKNEISTSSIQYNETQNVMEGGEIASITEDTVIQGIVESKIRA